MAKKKIIAVPPLLTRRDLAAALSVGRPEPLHMMTVTKWERDGMPIAERGGKGRPSKYDEAIVRAWLKTRDDSAKASNGFVDVARERARRDRAQAELAEQTFQMRSRELLPRVEVERQWEAEVVAVRAKLLQIAPAFAERVYQAAVSEGVGGVERALASSVNEVLLELSGTDDVPAVSA